MASKIKKMKLPGVNGEFDYYLFADIIILLLFGLVMVFSASSGGSGENKYGIFVGQVRWAVVGFIAMYVISRIDYHILGKFANLLLGITIVMLLAVLVIGLERNGARRWLGTESMSVQPSEIAKITMIIFMAFKLSLDRGELRKSWQEAARYGIIIVVVAGLVLMENHLSGAGVIGAVCFLMVFAAGLPMKYFWGSAAAAGVALIGAVAIAPYRLQRFMTFLDPFKYKMDEGWQIVQSLYAIGSGGLFGLGLGRSRQKYLYIPEPHNDFIFSIICEELGFFGAVGVIVLYAVFVYRGYKVALKAPDKFGKYLAFGITTLIAFQVIINILVVTSFFPATGMQLPLFSAGGSSMVFLLSGMGILLNVSRQSKKL